MIDEFLNQKTIIFGGSFNPPTIAHFAIIQKLLAYQPSKIILIPNGDLYFNKNLISFNHRAKMCELMIKEIKSDLIIINDIENQDYFKGTYYTLKSYDHPTMVIGSDCLINLKSWIKSDLLIQENNFIVFSRELSVEQMKIFVETDPFLKPYFNHFHFIAFNYKNVSSSKFRLTKDKMFVLKPIMKYINENKLYRGEK